MAGLRFDESSRRTGAAFALVALFVVGTNATSNNRILTTAEGASAKEANDARFEAIAQSGPNGAGAAEARAARDALAEQGLEILPSLLTQMDTANPIAANWLRTVYEPLVEQGLASEETEWPVAFLKQFVSDSSRRGRPRELALALLERLEPSFRAEWMPTRLDDPYFRHEAVAIALDAGKAKLREKQPAAAKAEFQKAFQHARDAAQVTQAAAQLKSLGEPADVVRHLGLLTAWRIIGPFDAPEKTGFATVFPPEKSLDFNAKHQGKSGAELRWTAHRTKDTLGQVNLIEALTNCREAVGYAYCEIDVPAATDAQLRCGADDNCSIWLNGEKVFGRDQWLNGTRFDRFTTPVKLRSGRNTVLVKACQGPQHRDPEVPNNWTFQIRLCDENGLGIAFNTRIPAAEE